MPDESPAPRRRPLAARLALVALSTLVSVALAEGALRVANVGEPILRDIDPVLGWAPIPGAEGVWTREGRAHVVITEHGFRGVDRPPEPDPSVFRLVVLGDSYTEAKQVELDEAYFRHVERALDACLERPVEVQAFGVSGYGTAQERLLYLHRARPYAPDAVLLAFLTGNDIADNDPALRVSGSAPYYRLEGDSLVLDDSFVESPDYRARASGGAWRWVRRRSRFVRLLGRLGSGARARAGRHELGLRDEIYAPPADADWRRAWSRTEAILAALAQDVVADDARFFVATLSNAIQVDPDPAARARYASERGVDPELAYADARVAAVGAREGFPVLNLAPQLRERAESAGEHLHGFDNTRLGAGHWNATGHRVAGEALGRWLCDELAPLAQVGGSRD